MTSNSIRIGPRDYRLRYRKLPDDDNRTLYGITTHTNRTMEINNSCPKSEQKETLLHEIIHCISCEHGLELSEQTVSTISAVLYDTIKRNKIRL
jgi:hypothetical protein